MTSPIENLSRPGKPLKAESPDAREFAGLRCSDQARLQDASNASLSLEGRFDLAYNAAHALCLAALRWHGYRSSNRISSFNCFRTRSALDWRSGACFPNVMTFATVASMESI